MASLCLSASAAIISAASVPSRPAASTSSSSSSDYRLVSFRCSLSPKESASTDANLDSSIANLPVAFLSEKRIPAMRCAGSRRSLVVCMAPEEERMTRRSPLDFPIEWERPKPGRRPDIFPQFSPMKTPLPPPLPADPPEEDEEEEEKKEEEEEDPEKEEQDNPEKQ